MMFLAILLIALSTLALLSFIWGTRQIGRFSPTINTTIGGRLAGLFAFLAWVVAVLGETYVFIDTIISNSIEDLSSFIIVTVMLTIINASVVFYFLAYNKK